MIARWVRDAAALELPPIDPDQARHAYTALAEHAFGRAGTGILRLEARRKGPWLGATRAVGEEAATWIAALADVVHPGIQAAPGVKRADLPALQAARDERARRGVDEVLLADAEGRIVEGARSNLVIVSAEGDLLTPPLARGGVAGVAREILVEALPELLERDLRRAELLRAAELVAINAVRGARPIVSLDDRPVADGAAGPWASRLAEILDAAP